ncbi:LacI family DNA-binding transcriptional regulator [Dictyobacter kobayashii]|uniref:LacI family transcriptional regulator n=1 Tax=Dictyobacter kobayashii TaxID=2014872 RepID=A0A402AIW3_9CHLR|nr:LacI family DNA-binding transcriptional regulator [Dictyobacter kobayashii]GCE19057.1 LacI family transcriptional regulator [Dictyobacter kobayashii]
MTKKLTIYDIARLAGVSKSTVSRVLTNNASVDPATAQHVRQVMEEHDFVPNFHASAIKGKSPFIGVIVPVLSWDLMSDLLLGLSRAIEASPFEIVLFTCNPAKGYRDILDRILATRMTAGLLVVPFAPVPTELITLYQDGMPVVLIDIVSWRVDLPSVSDDNVGGALAAVNHLLQLGHRRIAYVQGPAELPCYQERYQGYCMALRNAGLEPDSRLFFSGHDLDFNGQAAIEEIVKLPPSVRPTAIFTTSDMSACGVLTSSEEHGIHVPKDLALVSYNDMHLAAHTRPALTTVRQPFQDMGRRAAEMLLSLLNTSDSIHSLNIELPTQLIIRDSCGSSLTV